MKNHPWLRDFPWDDLLHQRLKSPFNPPNEDNFDAAYTNGEWKDQNSEQILQNMQLLDQENVQKAFVGYYHDENFNEEMMKEKKRIYDQPQQQTKNYGAQSTVNANGGGGNRNDSSMDSASQAEQQSKFSNYRGNAALLVSSSNNFSNANSTNGTRVIKRSDQSSSIPQSQEQPPRAKMYRQRDIDGMSNSGMSGMNSAAGASIIGSEPNAVAGAGQTFLKQNNEPQSTNS